MNNIEINGIEVSIPSVIEDLTVNDYINLVMVFSNADKYKNEFINANDDLINMLLVMDLVKVFVKGDINSDDIPIKYLNEISSKLEWLFNITPDDIKVEEYIDSTFELKGKTCKFITDLNKLTLGEYTDIQMMLSNEGISNYYQGMDILLTLLVREVVDGKLVKLEDPISYREDILNIPIIKVGWVGSFF